MRDVSTALSAGGVYSTTKDMYHWSRALTSGDLLSEKHKAMLLTGQTEKGILNSDDAYTFGWRLRETQVSSDKPPVHLLHHSGRIMGYQCVVIKVIEDDYYIILLDNTDSPHLYAIGVNILHLMYAPPQKETNG